MDSSNPEPRRSISDVDLSSPEGQIDRLIDSLVGQVPSLDDVDREVIRRRVGRDVTALIADRQREIARTQIEMQARTEGMAAWTATGRWQDAYAVLAKYAPSYQALAPLPRAS